MSADRLRLRTTSIAFKLLKLVVGWVFIAPIVLVMPRRRDWVVVIGKHGGKFIDNGKYFFIQGAPLLAPSNRCVFITDRRDTADMLAETDYEVGYYPSWRTIWFLARAGCVVFESAGWSSKLRGFLLIRARKIQLWHGVGFKGLTNLGQWANQRAGTNNTGARTVKWLVTLKRALGGHDYTYDLFNTTSTFYKEQVFEPVFTAKNFVITGYPRNAFQNFEKPHSDIVWKNVDPDIIERSVSWQAEGRRVVLVAPTLRTDHTLPLDLNFSLVDKLNAYGEQEKVVFIFKFHPASEGVSRLSREHVHVIDPTSDIYPLMPITDALVTDFSSIYMDYLFLDKPVLFYTPDKYEQDAGVGELQFDFGSMTPGPKAKSWDALLQSLKTQWTQDEYAKDRARLRRLAFDALPQEQSVPKLIEFLQHQGWIKPIVRNSRSEVWNQEA